MTKRQFISYAEMDSPLGPLTLVQSEKGMILIEFGAAKDVYLTIKSKLKKHLLCTPLKEDADSLKPVQKQLDEYFQGQRYEFDVPLDLLGTRFQTLVWKTLQSIPYGETKSYKQIALEIGAPKAVRAIGGANNQNPVPIIIPCHRVIGTNGSMVGYGGGIEKKETLLQLESFNARMSS
ncbi:methylated-DNA--[protein]-cysteine S-methyltransferase [Texcoconibacillus texcoconensis]|uniref:Methylated-DNA--protein-cysteine methyltransferase n=1 Tax=Texcoconibacillus texcoconensis TaxID=1095777 RepID=A0A840QPK5_9BACI|nr:methylated-DNA--[protein]-cysteine S-methyltransferase [Texcoconibacillus texcoconensis]MBB5173346.1 O-6-methylguanine DNA methyltransferase [Texcoconibacillus texcoconensis]